ncbi:MAG TPA: class I SAM-dependent methyltransferase [Gammaproteobacteria bacterium]
MSNDHHDFVAREYGPRANAYVESRVHAAGEDLDRIEALVRGRPDARVLDLGSGGGHVSLRVAPHVAEVVASDLSVEMLETVRRAATERGFEHISVRRCAAERLPFADDSFDIVLSRFSTHHWSDLDAGLREARRVLKADGLAVFVDSVSPGRPLLDTHLQAVEVLRDATHVRSYAADEWLAALSRAGFVVTSMSSRRLRIEFSPWIARTATPELHARAIRSLQTRAPAEVRTHFGIEADGSFMLETLLLEVR